MVRQLQTPASAEIIYPDSDGQPMADNTKQYRWIVTIQSGLDELFKNDPNVFVAADLLWYPVKGDNILRRAPDVMVAFGRPKGDRGSYKQWDEDNIPPQVVFEILSPGNTLKEMAEKFQFYDVYGVEEYYIYNPDRIDFQGWRRSEGRLTVIEQMQGWVSPRLGVQFNLEEELVIYRPDGQRFATYLEVIEQRDLERQRAEEERQRAEAAETRAEQAEVLLEQERQRAQALEARLRSLGIDPE